MPTFIAILIGAAAIVSGTAAEFSAYAATFGAASGFALVLDKLTALPVVKIIE